MSIVLRALFACAVLLAVACSSAPSRQAAMLPYTPDAGAPAAAPGQYIKHVVIIVQENRTLNMIFAGYPGATTALTAKNSSGSTVKLTPISFKDRRGDIGHAYKIAVGNWDNGKMDAFDKNFISLTSSPAGNYPYSYLRRADVKPYWDMAQQYVLADEMFPEEWGSSFTGHQDLISGTTDLSATTAVADNPNNSPWGCGAPPKTWTNLARKPASGSGPGTLVPRAGPFPCYTHVSMAAVLDAKHVSWKYYAPAIGKNAAGTLWSAFSAIKAVYYGPDWKNDASPPQTVLSDVKNRTLPAVSWVIPDFADSDHPGARSATGPSWVATVINAIGKSQYWKSTAIVVVWDDYGGWYDPVPPPQKDYLGLAIRVPCLIVSPYAKRGYVDHTQYEFASILKTTEQIFGLASMRTTDARAASMFGAFDFMQKPRSFVPLPQTFSEEYFLRQPASGLPPDSD